MYILNYNNMRLQKNITLQKWVILLQIYLKKNLLLQIYLKKKLKKAPNLRSKTNFDTKIFKICWNKKIVSNGKRKYDKRLKKLNIFKSTKIIEDILNLALLDQVQPK